MFGPVAEEGADHLPWNQDHLWQCVQWIAYCLITCATKTAECTACSPPIPAIITLLPHFFVHPFPLHLILITLYGNLWRNKKKRRGAQKYLESKQCLTEIAMQRTVGFFDYQSWTRHKLSEKQSRIFLTCSMVWRILRLPVDYLRWIWDCRAPLVFDDLSPLAAY